MIGRVFFQNFTGITILHKVNQQSNHFKLDLLLYMYITIFKISQKYEI
jgi:hypothetical protein